MYLGRDRWIDLVNVKKVYVVLDDSVLIQTMVAAAIYREWMWMCNYTALGVEWLTSSG